VPALGGAQVPGFLHTSMMRATWQQTWDSNEERDSEIASSATEMQPTSRGAKTVGVACLVAALVLLGFAAGRATAGGCMKTSELKCGAMQENQLTKIRKPATEGQCAAANGVLLQMMTMAQDPNTQDLTAEDR